MTEQIRNEEFILSDPAGVPAPADLGVPAAVVWVVLFMFWALGKKNQRGSTRSKSGFERLLEADSTAQEESDDRVAAAARREEEGGW